MGRKRKTGPRTSSGRLSRAATPQQVEPISGVKWQRILKFGKRLGADERLATELGRLTLFGQFTPAQSAAGHRIAEIYGRFEGYKNLRRSTRSPSYERAYGEAGVAEDLMSPEALERLEGSIRGATEDFERLVGKAIPIEERPKSASLYPPVRDRQPYVRGLIPRPLLNPIEQLCVEDRPISASLYAPVGEVLSICAQMWSISTRGSGEAAPVKAQPKPRAAARKRNVDRAAWLEVMARLRPDLPEKDLSNAYEIAIALKDRQAFEAKKPVRPPAIDPATASVAVKLDRPMLKLKERAKS